MKSKLYLALVCLSLSFGVHATPLSPDEALARLSTDGAAKAAVRNKAVTRLVYTQNTENNSPAVYVFNNGNSVYFLSADDVAAPLLGYAENGSFDPQNLPPQLKEWMEGYAMEIEMANQNNLGKYKVSAKVSSKERDVIEPLVSTKWNQEPPFNLECPVIDGRTCVTGCVATSMAMAMNYFKYPEKGQGNIKYTTSTYKKSLMMNFAKESFDWGNMLDVYKKGEYDDTQAYAVAYLMKSCGYAIQMDYTPEESGAVSADVAEALKKYFSYDKGTYYALRSFYSPSVWEDMIYDNLKNIGPIIYNGASSIAGGHSFICDGYDGNGYFHFNWGWGGMSDGYFLLNSLSPAALGVGGGAGGFNFRQGAVLGMQPPKEGTVAPVNFLQQMGSLTGEVNGSTVTFSTTSNDDIHWTNNGCPTFTCNFAAIVENTENASDVKYFNTGVSLTYSSNIYFPSYLPSFSFASLSDGRYKVTLATRDYSTQEYAPVKCDYQYNNYVFLTKTGNEYTVERPKDKFPTITSIKLESELYPGVTAKIVMSVKNDLDEAVSAALTPVLYYDDKAAFSAASVAVDLQPKEEMEIPIYTQFSSLPDAPYMNEDREMTLMVADYALGLEATYPGVSEVVTLHANPGRLSLRQKGIVVNSEKNEDGVYLKSSTKNLTFTYQVNVASGVFAYPLYILVFDETGSVMQVAENFGGPMTVLETGKTYDFDCKLEFPQGIIGDTYSCYLGYQNSGNYSRIGSGFKFKIVDESGISNIITEEDDLPEMIFNLQGVRIENPKKGEIVIIVKGNTSRKIIW